MRSTGHQAGFTLVETLVAFAIFSLSSVAILQTYSTSSRSQARAQASVETSAQLAQLLASAEARFETPGELTGEDVPGYPWSLSLMPRGPDLLELKATVHDPQGRATTATTLRWRAEIFPGEAVR